MNGDEARSQSSEKVRGLLAWIRAGTNKGTFVDGSTPQPARAATQFSDACMSRGGKAAQTRHPPSMA